ncbi:5327_t:CDS:2, partial [Scutellospora calospora]
IYHIYDAAEYNKKTCRVLVDRVDNVATAVRKLNRRKDEEEKKFHDNDYIKTFIKLQKIKTKCLTLTEELESTCNELQFGIVISMEDRALEQKSLTED